MSLRHPDVIPVLHELIEVFKHPPEGGAEEKEFEEELGLIDDHALTGTGKE